MNKNDVYFEGEVENAIQVALEDGKILLELSGYGADKYCSLNEDIEETFPDFKIEEGKYYLIVDDDELSS